MRERAFITCAVTGASDSVTKSDKVPVTPAQIAASAGDAAAAGAAVVHIHVRDPKTGKTSRDLALYREVVDRIRSSKTDVVINLTGGHGCDLILGDINSPIDPYDPASDLVGVSKRLEHAAELLPEICTIDCGSMNFGLGSTIMVNTPDTLIALSQRMRELSIRPEIEVFDSGHLALAKWLVDNGHIDGPVLLQLCMGIPWGAPDDLDTFSSLVRNVPSDWVFSAFSIGRNQIPFTAMALLAGGNIRVGLEDNLWVSRGVKATNGALVERAASIAANLGVGLMSPNEVRNHLQLRRP